MDLETYSSGSNVDCLEPPRATDFISQRALMRGATDFGSGVPHSGRLLSYRFWIWRATLWETTLLGGYSLALPILDLATQMPVLEVLYRTLSRRLVV